MQVVKNNMPNREEIRARAHALALERQITGDLPAITPTDEELKESGVWEEARLDLMRVTQQTLADQEKYLSDMAQEMGFELLAKEDFEELLTRNKLLAWKARAVPVIQRDAIPPPEDRFLGRKPEFLVKANTSKLLNMSEHQAALEVALARGRLALETSVIKSAEEHRMRHFLQYVRDLNSVKTLQWKVRQEKWTPKRQEKERY